MYFYSSPLDGMLGFLSAQGHRVVLHAQIRRVELGCGPILSRRHVVSLRRQR